ncbi:hypothetical protein BH24CHL7_BH24CHL7_06700 [soil metagenome]
MNVNLSALFASAPAAYTFPATWTEAHAALSMLSSERTGATRQRDEAHVRWQGAERDRAREIFTAARAGKVPADVAEPVLDAKADDDRLTIAAHVLTLALKFAEDDLTRTVVAEADAFITDHLAPALAEVVETVRATAPTLDGLDLRDPATLSRASEPVRAAYDATLAASERLFAIRQVSRHSAGCAVVAPRLDWMRRSPTSGRSGRAGTSCGSTGSRRRHRGVPIDRARSCGSSTTTPSCGSRPPNRPPRHAANERPVPRCAPPDSTIGACWCRTTMWCRTSRRWASARRTLARRTDPPVPQNDRTHARRPRFAFIHGE